MVQIILPPYGCPKPCQDKLYIPHGSDNTHDSNDVFSFFCSLYIPHGSDNTDPFSDATPKVCNLYIPHGSDNTYKL